MSKTALEVADELVACFRWADRPQSLGAGQARILREDQWVGITTSPYDSVVRLHIGTVTDGTPSNPQGECNVDDSGDIKAVVDALEALQDRVWGGPQIMNLSEAAEHLLHQMDTDRPH